MLLITKGSIGTFEAIEAINPVLASTYGDVRAVLESIIKRLEAAGIAGSLADHKGLTCTS